jgi:gamma-glutamyl-gamma-aminobutyrate hydrolase PuuD
VYRKKLKRPSKMSKKFKVAIVGRDSSQHMFSKRGFEIVELLGGETPDLIQFTGGEDVDPSLYGHSRHPSTYSNPRRDAHESQIYHNYLGKVAFAGICRGGQLLNVLNGGTMFQHVDNHGGDHLATDLATGAEIVVTSTHHQMMIPAAHGVVLMTAARSKVRWIEQKSTIVQRDKGDVDVEAIVYPKTQSLCYQPHPEYLEPGEACQEIYFDYLKQHLNIG